MKVVFLGTNGWFDTPTGNTICTVIQTKAWDLILDAGYGIAKLGRYVRGDKPAFLFLSHFHLDHVVGLHTLNLFRLPRGLVVGVQEGGREILGRLAAPPFTVPLDSLPYPARVVELPAESASLPFPVVTAPLLHSTPTLGFRFALEGRVIAYCPDTGYCENAVSLARGADLVITECAYKSGQASADWPHLNPETAARIAGEAQARRLVLTHFDAGLYADPADRGAAEKAARKIFRNTTAARDGMEKRL